MLLPLWMLAGSLAVSAPSVSAIEAQVPAASHAALEAGIAAWRHAVESGAVSRADVLTVIDYSRPSTEKRLFVVDVGSGRVLFRERVAHGRGSGENTSENFSNLSGSHKTSLGVFRAENAYEGAHGLSLRLAGLEPGFNDRARDRAIVLHGAGYVSEAMVASQRRLGRSWGCPAVRPEVARPLIEAIRDGSLLVAYYPDADWLRRSTFLSDAAAATESRAAGRSSAR